MPIYDYMCKTCGPFTALMPMSASADDLACPECGAAAPRALLTVPHLSRLSSGARKAHAANEKSSHNPETTAATGRHPPGCACCKPTRRQADAPMKTFPTSRPWMISH